MKGNKSAIALMLIIAACGSSDRDINRYSGTYATQYSHTYATGLDTVSLRRFGAQTFKIERHTTYRKIRGGALQPPEQSRHSYTGLYRKKTATILETRGGAVLSLDKKGNTLIWGTTEYKRIN